ncbi:hypothetical protein E4T56_gene460 [Termitomyces sp. T112]|nr:hypothetical protein E4T56_gene460 [Termitomyces sp. T112]
MPNPLTNTYYFGPPPPEDPLPLGGPWGLPQAMQANSLVAGLPPVDYLEDGAQPWTTSPLNTEMETITITTTTLDPHPELKTPRTILAMHWLRKESSTFKSPDPSLVLESSWVAFAASYLQGIAFNHYMALLQFNPNNTVLSNWPAFTQEFSSKFGIFDTVVEAEENLFNLQMHDNEHFMTFSIQFEWEAYKTGWNYNALQSALQFALQFALHCTLPQQIKNILCLAPK